MRQTQLYCMQQRPCKFGARCKKLPHCNFFHPPADFQAANQPRMEQPYSPYPLNASHMNNMHMSNNTGFSINPGSYYGNDGSHHPGMLSNLSGGFAAHRSGFGNYHHPYAQKQSHFDTHHHKTQSYAPSFPPSNYNNGPHRPNYAHNSSFKQANSGFKQANSGFKQANSGFKQPSSGFKQPSEQGSLKLCRNFQLGLGCKYGDNCKHKHGFTFGADQPIIRLIFERGVPTHMQSKLCRFKSAEKEYFSLRNGLEITFFECNYQTKELAEVHRYTLPYPTANYNYYDHKAQFVYFTKENPDTLFEDMAVHDMAENRLMAATNSHMGKVTAIVHFTPSIVVTTSMEAELKIWRCEGQQLQCHQQATQKLKACFNPQNAKLQLYFVDIAEVNATKVVCVGTSDGRLLFFFGEELSYQEVQVSEQYSKVFMVKYAVRGSTPTALILTWNNLKTHSAILEINLLEFSSQVLVEVRTTEDQPKQLLNTFEIAHGYLLVASLSGLVSIYGYPRTGPKLGCIYHHNQVGEIIACEETLKNTNLHMKTIMVLERKGEKHEGSLAVYLLK